MEHVFQLAVGFRVSICENKDFSSSPLKLGTRVSVRHAVYSIALAQLRSDIIGIRSRYYHNNIIVKCCHPMFLIIFELPGCLVKAIVEKTNRKTVLDHRTAHHSLNVVCDPTICIVILHLFLP